MPIGAMGGGGWWSNSHEDRGIDTRLKFLEAIAKNVEEQRTRIELPETDSLVQYLSECSGKESYNLNKQ